MEENYAIPNIWCSFDLEMEQPEGYIIQIGAVAFDIYTGKIVDKLKIYVRPPDNKPLSEFIIKLTGITQEQIDREGRSLLLGYCEIKDFMARNKCFRDPVCWGGNDGAYLRTQLKLRSAFNSTNEKFCFGSSVFDTKKFYQVYCAVNGRKTMRGGQATAQNSLGMPFKGRVHDALDDATNGVPLFLFLSKSFKKEQK